MQVIIKSREIAYARQIRAKAESYGMYFEGQLSLPKDDADAERFERDLGLAKEAGASIVRTACLSGRRYETFHSAAEFQRFRDQSQNQRDCLAKLREMLASVAVPPKRRRRTKPTKGSVVRRQNEKRAHSQKKQNRRTPGAE